MDSTSFRRLTSRLPDPLLAVGLGALVAGIAAAALAAWFQVDRSERDLAFSVSLVLMAILTGGLVLRIIATALRIVPTTDLRPIGASRFADGARVAAVLLVTAVAAFMLIIAWRGPYVEDGTHHVVPVLLAASAVLFGVSRLAFLLRSILWNRGIPLRPSWQTRMANATKDTTEGTEAEPWRGTAARSWALTAGAALAPALAVVLIVSGVKACLPQPDFTLSPIQELDDPVSKDERPMPTAAPTEVAWSAEFTMPASNVALAAGVRGPIIMTDEGVVGLDAQYGSPQWSYHLPEADRWSKDDRTDYVMADMDRYALVSSPDLRHVAFMVDTRDESFKAAKARIVVVLDTLTGRVTAQHTHIPDPDRYDSGFGGLQLTDSAALIGTEVIALEGGRKLGSIPDAKDARIIYSGTGGHTTFVLAGESENSSYRKGLMLVPDSDLSARVPLDHACLSPNDRKSDNELAIHDGWTALCQGEADSDQITVWDMAAINLDEAASAGDASAVETIPLGKGVGINIPASQASGAIITRAQYFSDDNPAPVPVSVSPTPVNPFNAMVFDPRTRTAVPVNESGSIGTAIFQYTASTDRDNDWLWSDDGWELRIVPTDGSTPITLPRTGRPGWTSMDDKSREFLGVMALPYEDQGFTPGKGAPFALTTPGGVVVGLWRGAHSTGNTVAFYGLR